MESAVNKLRSTFAGEQQQQQQQQQQQSEQQHPPHPHHSVVQQLISSGKNIFSVFLWSTFLPLF